MNRIYIVPVVLKASNRGIGPGAGQPSRSAAYISDLTYKYGALDYGSEDVMLVLVRDISTADHDTLAARSDVIAIPEDLDANMTSGQVNGAKNFYDTLNIPGGWINTNRTVRQVVKITGGMFQFNQRWSGISNGTSPFKVGLDLSTVYSTMSDLNKGRIQVVFDSLNIDISSLTGSSTLGEALREFGIQMASRPLYLGGIEI